MADELLVAYVEDCVLSDFAVVAANHGTVHLTPRSHICSWETLEGVPRTLGFRSDHADAWVAMGVVPSRTTKEQVTALQRRLELLVIVWLIDSCFRNGLGCFLIDLGVAKNHAALGQQSHVATSTTQQ